MSDQTNHQESRHHMKRRLVTIIVILSRTKSSKKNTPIVTNHLLYDGRPDCFHRPGRSRPHTPANVFCYWDKQCLRYPYHQF